MEEKISKVWVTDDYTNVLFTQEDMDNVMDSVDLDKMKTGFGYWGKKLIKPFTRSEILDMSAEELKKIIE